MVIEPFDEVEDPGTELEPTIDSEISPMMEPPAVLTCRHPATPPREYWNAQIVATAIHRRFEALKETGDVRGMRRQFYVLAHYYGRTLGVLRQALSYGREPLISSALQNIMSLHQPLHHMHDIASTAVPFVLTLDNETRKHLIKDLVVKVLEEAMQPLELKEIAGSANRLHFMAEVPKNIIFEYTNELKSEGYIEKEDSLYNRSRKPYSSINLDRAALKAFLDEKLYHEFEQKGFPSVSSIVNRKGAFLSFFQRFVNCRQSIAELFISTASVVLGQPSHAPESHPWPHADLIGSLYPRPYQYKAYSIFRDYGYQAKVMEAPSGSGKTMIGMMCIQDWLRNMSQGESILVLVPTINYRQQWVGELSYNGVGLQLAPEAIFAGTPAELKRLVQRTQSNPPLLIMTYSALSKLEASSVESLLTRMKVRYIILDEVHKVVDDLNSPSAAMTKNLSTMLSQGKIHGFIGFSGTAAAYREKFAEIGLELVYIIPSAELIAHGFVAPFAEFGIPFTYSEREMKVRSLLQEYKKVMNQYLEQLDLNKLTSLFSDIETSRRFEIARDFLQMYEGDPGQEEKIKERFEAWSQVESLNLNKVPLLLIAQMALNYSDNQLLSTAGKNLAAPSEPSSLKSRELIAGADRIRQYLKDYMDYPDIRNKLDYPGFGSDVDFAALFAKKSQTENRAMLKEFAREKLAATVFGLYLSLKDFYYRAGQGHIDCIKSIIDAEQQTRRVSGVIIFDKARHLPLEDGQVTAQYSGVGGLFLHMLNEAGFTPMAATSSEIYLPWNEINPLPVQIARFIKEQVMYREIGNSIFRMVTQNLRLPKARLDNFNSVWNEILQKYIHYLSSVSGARHSEFGRMVISSFRRSIFKEIPKSLRGTLRSRLNARNQHLHNLIDTFFDYGLLAERFLRAKEVTLQTPAHVQRRFFVVKMPSDERNQLMYELLSRIVNSPGIPVNVVIVSTWARTGWNVFSPNVLIDATATRDTTAWQQLRGRALRAAPDWDERCSELLMHILGSYLGEMAAVETVMSPDEAMVAGLWQKFHVDLERGERKILRDLVVAGNGNRSIRKLVGKNIERMDREEREKLATALLLSRNKITHIYELVKAYGSPAQVSYNRSARRWHRTEAVARKHSQEYSINPFSGEYVNGEAHAPLIYSGNPRMDSPQKLGQYLADRLTSIDPNIVEGWIKAMTSDNE
ncbi:MAG: DEAD/DEAH box helicase family protein [Dehalococcoidales bacterium]|nr:DEAD/DEAH box helicase family protein [Dehalococcoidales bacterium]